MNHISFLEVSLNNLLETLESGKRPKGGVQGINNGIPSIGGEHLNYDGNFNFLNIKYVPVEYAQSMKKGNVQLHDILIVKDGATTGKIAYVSDSFPYKNAVINEHVFICRLYKSINSKYIFYFLFSAIGQKRILINFKGSAQGGINATFIDNVQIPLPPLPEQRVIVSKIEQLFSELDNGIESLKKAKEQIKVYRHAVLKKAFEGELTWEWRERKSLNLHQQFSISEQIQVERQKEFNKRMEEWAQKVKGWEASGKSGKKPAKPSEIKELAPITENELNELPVLPEGWEYTYLTYIGELNRGKSKHRPRNDKKLFGGKYPFIQTGEVKSSNGIINEFYQTYNEFGLTQSKLWPIGTLCITIAANIAETAFLGIEACFPDSIVGYVSYGKISNSRYVCYFIKSIRSKIDAYAPATAQKNINLEILENLLIPLCPLPEQNQIVQEIETRFSVCDNMEKNIDEALQKADALRQSILKKAFEGRLLTDEELEAARMEPDWEPAEKLLERIKKEKKKNE